ncbi:MAG: IPExxxVDY family protein [Crocinitomicaceae bacterium]
MKKTTIHKLLVESEVHCIFGISTGLADYRLAWELNQKLEIKLLLSEETTSYLDNKTSEITLLRLYKYYDEEMNRSYTLLKNRQTAQPIIQELHQMDYFLLTEYWDDLSRKEILSKMRSTNGIGAVFCLEEEASRFFEQFSL